MKEFYFVVYFGLMPKTVIRTLVSICILSSFVPVFAGCPNVEMKIEGTTYSYSQPMCPALCKYTTDSVLIELRQPKCISIALHHVYYNDSLFTVNVIHLPNSGFLRFYLKCRPGKYSLDGWGNAWYSFYFY